MSAELEPIIRASFFIGVLFIMMVWETLRPQRSRLQSRWRRWTSNFGLIFTDTLVLRLTLGAIAVQAALWAEANGWGVFNQVQWPVLLAGLGAFILLDLLIYFQHRVFHAVPLLWRLHRVHHTDVDFDVTTALRFHPIEIFLSALIKAAAVIAIGAPVLAVIIFEIVLNATASFNHANVRMPTALDRVLRLFVVTPDMHRVHHSVEQAETDSNFGFNLPWWDRLFGTYVAQPREGHNDMTIGLDVFREAQEGRLDKLLIQPFRRS